MRAVERLISDRIDGALAERDEARLDVHLRNCPRCVEHERRLVQATDALVAGVAPVPVAPRARRPRSPPRSESWRKGGADRAEPPRPPARRSPRELAGAVGWNALLVVAIVLALASLALALAGALGAQF